MFLVCKSNLKAFVEKLHVFEDGEDFHGGVDRFEGDESAFSSGTRVFGVLDRLVLFEKFFDDFEINHFVQIINIKNFGRCQSFFEFFRVLTQRVILISDSLFLVSPKIEVLN